MSRACKPIEPPLLLATDLDGTLLDNTYRFDTRVPDILEVLQDAGVVVALVTSKTLDEAMMYARRLRLREDCPGYILVVEEGGLVYASNERLLPERLEVLAEPIDLRLVEKIAPRECRGRLKSLELMSPEDIAALTGLPLLEADAARLRRSVTAFHAPRECLEALCDTLSSLGFYTRLGDNFLMAAAGAGKARALRRVKRVSPVLRSTPVLAVGDSEVDREMLEEADYAILVPGPGGVKMLLHRCDHIVAPSPPPSGWVEAIEALLPLLGVQSGYATP